MSRHPCTQGTRSMGTTARKTNVRERLSVHQMITFPLHQDAALIVSFMEIAKGMGRALVILDGEV